LIARDAPKVVEGAESPATAPEAKPAASAEAKTETKA